MKLIKSYSINGKIISPNHKTHWSTVWKNNKFLKKKLENLLFFDSLHIDLPVHVELVRCDARFIDSHDNLGFAFKGFVDFIADILIPGLKPGQADGDPRLSFSYKQEKCKGKEAHIIINFYENRLCINGENS